MPGSTIKRGKTWSYYVDVGRDPKTRRRRRKWVSGFRTKREAETALAAFVTKLETGADPFPKHLTLTQFTERWLTHQAEAGRIRPRTLKRYGTLLASHVLGEIGDVQLRRLRPAHIELVLTTMTAKGRAPRTVIQTRAVLASALRQAVAWDLMDTNPVSSVKPPKADRPTLKVPSQAQLVALLTESKGTRWEIPLLLAATTAARRSEILALRWSDVDLPNTTLYVRRSLQRREGGTPSQFLEPKSKRSRRTISLHPAVARRLELHRREQLQVQLAAPVWTDNDLICCRNDGRPLDPDAMSKGFKKLAESAGLHPDTRLHDLRHAVATMLAKAGTHPKTVSAMLGHSSVSFTLDTYTEAWPEGQQKAADDLGDALNL